MTNQRGEGVGKRLRASFIGVMGEDGSVEDMGYEVLRIFGWPLLKHIFGLHYMIYI